MLLNASLAREIYEMYRLNGVHNMSNALAEVLLHAIMTEA